MLVRLQSYKKFERANFVQLGVKKIYKRGPLPQMGGDSPFVLKLLDTIEECLLTCKKFWGSAFKKRGKCPPKLFKPQNLKIWLWDPLIFFHLSKALSELCRSANLKKNPTN